MQSKPRISAIRPSPLIRASSPPVRLAGRPIVIAVPGSTEDIIASPPPGAAAWMARTTCRPPWRIRSGFSAKARGPSASGATPISRAYSSVAGSALIVRIIRRSGIASVTTIRSLDGVKWSKITSSTG